jgi:hypothetical protein
MWLSCDVAESLVFDMPGLTPATFTPSINIMKYTSS